MTAYEWDESDDRLAANLLTWIEHLDREIAGAAKGGAA
jgi:hypothetical protein